jgi:hypothetical protein
MDYKGKVYPTSGHKDVELTLESSKACQLSMDPQ